jgi:hypothetical protein
MKAAVKHYVRQKYVLMSLFCLHPLWQGFACFPAICYLPPHLAADLRRSFVACTFAPLLPSTTPRARPPAWHVSAAREQAEKETVPPPLHNGDLAKKHTMNGGGRGIMGKEEEEDNNVFFCPTPTDRRRRRPRRRPHNTLCSLLRTISL